MDKLSKIKEWILVNYTKKIIINTINNRINSLCVSEKYYNDNLDNIFEWEIHDNILKNVNYKFTLNNEQIEKISFFTEKYIKVIIPSFRNKHRVGCSKIIEEMYYD